MTRWVLLAAFLLGSLWIAGCCGDGLMHTEEEWCAQRRDVNCDDRAQLVDDWHLFWQYERKARTTRFVRGD